MLPRTTITARSVRVPETESNRCAALRTIGRFAAAAGSARTLAAPRVASTPTQKPSAIRLIVYLPPLRLLDIE